MYFSFCYAQKPSCSTDFIVTPSYFQYSPPTSLPFPKFNWNYSDLAIGYNLTAYIEVIASINGTFTETGPIQSFVVSDFFSIPNGNILLNFNVALCFRC